MFHGPGPASTGNTNPKRENIVPSPTIGNLPPETARARVQRASSVA